MQPARPYPNRSPNNSGGRSPVATIRDRLHEYALLCRLDKPIGALLLLWPTLWALWLAADGKPDPLIVAVFVIGVFVMRSAGCVINDFADRDLDPQVKRTRDRPIAAHRVRPREALLLFLALCLCAFALVLTLNPLSLLLSFPGVLLAASYPFMKRYTYLPQVHLGVAFGWGVPMAFAALTDSVPALAWLLLASVVMWALAYDTMYAMVDRDDDLKVGVKSSAILFGRADRAWVGFFQLALLAILVSVAVAADLGISFYLGLIAAATLFGYQQYLIRERTREGCFRAFLNNNWVGAALFAGLVSNYLVS